ncbi:cysteine-rich CWC family protein [Pseudomonas sp. NPDC087358]|uniref:cysteine-rich CWC family protein n=1 Tax=Pseudomonas sp. NPDC087358 TaxID=3364439 RepID=UPI00384AC5E3
MSTALISPDICPACGQNNRCTLADPRTVDQPCWCFSETIDPAVLAALPPELRDRACLCPRCAGLVENVTATPL